MGFFESFMEIVRNAGSVFSHNDSPGTAGEHDRQTGQYELERGDNYYYGRGIPRNLAKALK